MNCWCSKNNKDSLIRSPFAFYPRTLKKKKYILTVHLDNTCFICL